MRSKPRWLCVCPPFFAPTVVPRPTTPNIPNIRFGNTPLGILMLYNAGRAWGTTGMHDSSDGRGFSDAGSFLMREVWPVQDLTTQVITHRRTILVWYSLLFFLHT
jgi:hypothetical protein